MHFEQKPDRFVSSALYSVHVALSAALRLFSLGAADKLKTRPAPFALCALSRRRPTSTPPTPPPSPIPLSLGRLNDDDDDDDD